jgi:peptidoglycan/LPS O-acetylase OafA/YrhL
LLPGPRNADIGGVESAAPSEVAPPRLWSLDVLRGICAGMVFLSHWHLWSDFAPRGAVESFVREFNENIYRFTTLLTWPTGGQHPAVIGFFVLSGFCIHYPFEYRAHFGSSAARWRPYFRRRFLRIIPVYWAACSLGLVVVLLEKFWPSGNALLGWHAATTQFDALVRFVGLAGIYPHEVFAGNATLTTVSVEIVMYALYPAFHWFSSRGRWGTLGTLFVLLQVAGVAMLKYLSPFWVYNSIIMLGVFWYAGALGAHLFVTGRGRVSGWGLLLAWALFLGLKALPHFTGLNLLKQAAWGVVCVTGILWALRVEQEHPPLGTRSATRMFRWIADLSYSLYAMHTPAILLATWTLLQFGVSNYLAQLGATMAATIVATLIGHYCIERVFYRPRSVVNPAGGQPPRKLAPQTFCA